MRSGAAEGSPQLARVSSASNIAASPVASPQLARVSSTSNLALKRSGSATTLGKPASPAPVVRSAEEQKKAAESDSLIQAVNKVKAESSGDLLKYKQELDEQMQRVAEKVAATGNKNPFVGVGSERGILIWRIEKFEAAPWPTDCTSSYDFLLLFPILTS